MGLAAKAHLDVNYLDCYNTIFLTSGDPSLRGGNGIPPRCVYLEEMAADLDGQDWLDMDNIEQVEHQSQLFLVEFLSSH